MGVLVVACEACLLLFELIQQSSWGVLRKKTRPIFPTLYVRLIRLSPLLRPGVLVTGNWLASECVCGVRGRFLHETR